MRGNITQYTVDLTTVPADWFLGVFVFHGPEAGISLYIDGNLLGLI